MRILLVDDSAIMRKIQKKVLQSLGFEDITEAEDGVSALVKVEAARFDLILLDWNMPNMDGLTFLQTIRSQDLNIPVIMVTTEAEKERVIKALQAGANSYVIKPFTPELLGQRVKEVVDKLLVAAS